VMGFTGGPGHIWQTTNAGASWTDFTGTAANALPDSPVNAVIVDPGTHIIYVGTDVGVFQSATSSAAWTELGPSSSSQQTGFLPNVAVTALALFNSGGQKLLRASTYGRGVWQFNLIAAPNFQIAVSNTPLTAFAGTTPTFNGTITAVNGYNSSVTLSCTTGSSSPPTPCTPNPATFTPTSTGAAFSLTTGNAIGDYSFNLLAVGSDPNNTTQVAALTLHVINLGLTTPTPSTVNEPRGATSPPVSFQVTAQGSFNQSVSLSCSFLPLISGATCGFTPGAVVNPTSASPVNATATVTAPAGTTTGNYTVTLQATTTAAPEPSTASFTMVVTTNPGFILSEPNPFPNVKEGSTGTSGPIAITSQDGFASTVTLSCPDTFGASSCSISPSSVSAFPTSVNLIINGTSFTAGTYQIAVQGTSGSITNSLAVPFYVGDYLITGPLALSSAPGGQVPANLTFTSTNFYSGQVNATCDATALPGAQCTLSPPNPITISASASVPVTATINVPNNATPGVYNININSQDVSGAPSSTWTIALTVNQDFTIGSLTPTTQTITAGQSASYNFSVLPVGSSFTNAVTFSCSGAPVVSFCSFTPNPVTPGNSSAAVVMQITTTAGAASLSLPGPRSAFIFYPLWPTLAGLVLLRTRGRRRKNARNTLPVSLLGLVLLVLLLPSCGGGGSNGGGGGGGGGGQQQGTQPGTYTISVTGTSGTLSHQAASTVTLVVSQ
jgi:hypothetical protein